MRQNINVSNQSGISLLRLLATLFCILFIGLLTILFIALKLSGVISWSWWLVLAPALIPAGIIFAILIFMALFALFAILRRNK